MSLYIIKRKSGHRVASNCGFHRHLLREPTSIRVAAADHSQLLHNALQFRRDLLDLRLLSRIEVNKDLVKVASLAGSRFDA